MSYPPTPPPAHPGGEPPSRAYFPGPPVKAKKKKWPWIVGALALLLLVCGGIGIASLVGAGNAVNNAVQEVESNQQGTNAKDAQLGKAARDGKFEFTVKAMKCGVKSLGPAEFGVKAQGQFCLVDVVVKNIGSEAQIFDGSSQYAYDARNTQFSHDATAATHANEGTATFLEQINPGNQVTGKLVFDVPAGTKITSVVLHDSLLSAGVRVTFA